MVLPPWHGWYMALSGVKFKQQANRIGTSATGAGIAGLFVLMYWFAISTGPADNSNIIKHLAPG
jgi:hypothetical protein